MMARRQLIQLLFLGLLLLLGESMASARNLRTYRKRRNVQKSGEPAGKVHAKDGAPIFVIQKHDASHLHYDLRLYISGVLVSWAVPKGPSVSPRIKRLAIPTDDHPLEYADFEGIIPQGYGAGTVMVWDKGTYTNLKEKDGREISMEQCLKDGRIEIFLEGKKLKGAYALVRTQRDMKGWLLIKIRDEYANTWQVPKKDRERSVVTGRTLQQIAREG